VSHNVGVPRLPEPTAEWSTLWMRDFIRVLNHWMMRMTSETQEEAGAVAFSTVTVSTAIGPSDGFVLVDTTGGNITITLPDASTVLGREFSVKRLTAGANTLTVDTVSGDIDGSASLSIVSQYSTVTFKSDGTDYYLMGGYIGAWVP